jgi:predicted dinucleotide-binding enzyme
MDDRNEEAVRTAGCSCSRRKAAFSTVRSEVPFGEFEARQHKSTRPDLMYCGGDPDAKGVVAGLIRDLGSIRRPPDP